MLGSQGATLVQVLTPAEEMKWKLITLPFETAFLQLMRFQVSPGVPSLFHPKKKKGVQAEGEDFLHFFTLSRPPEAKSKPWKSRKSRYIHRTGTNQLQTCMQRVIPATTHFVEPVHTRHNHLGSPQVTALTPCPKCRLPARV